MQWPSMDVLSSAVPAHCTPSNSFLIWFSRTFHTCVPTPLAFASNTLGTCSIIAWLFAQLPQIYKNWRISSTAGLSIFFLVEWCLGDISNLLGALFTHQATWQVAIGAYYVFVDLCLLAQWGWYERLRHGLTVQQGWIGDGTTVPEPRRRRVTEVVIHGVPVDSEVREPRGRAKDGSDSLKVPSKPRLIFRMPSFTGRAIAWNEGPASLSTTPGGTTIVRATTSSPLPSPSPRTLLLVACLVAIVHASPLTAAPASRVSPPASQSTPLESAGTVLSWMSTVLYLGSRLPQIIKNWRRKSTAGLSPHLFLAAFSGNLFYSAALLTNPCTWYDYGPYGGGGWVGPEGSVRSRWVLAALPFFLGAAGVLGLDATVGVQFLVYGDGVKVVVVEPDPKQRWRWRKLSVWMRGWDPSISERENERFESLRGSSNRHSEGYGTMT